MIKMLLVEDIEMMKDALIKSLGAVSDIEITETLSSSLHAAKLSESARPDLVLMDICTAEGASGIEAAREIKQTLPEIKVVLMTAFSDMTFQKRAEEAGADSFIYKDIGTAELVDVIRHTMAGEHIYPEKRGALRFESTDTQLTDREIEVLRLMCKGLSNTEIARELFIAENTVVTHINNLREKSGITKKSKFIAYAIEHGYIVTSV